MKVITPKTETQKGHHPYEKKFSKNERNWNQHVHLFEDVQLVEIGNNRQ